MKNNDSQLAKLNAMISKPLYQCVFYYAVENHLPVDDVVSQALHNLMAEGQKIKIVK
jgi:hypothetical protein